MPPRPDAELTLNPRRILLGLLAAGTLLTVASLGTLVAFRVVGRPGWLVMVYELVFLDREGNLPTLFSTLQLTGAAVLLGLVAAAHRHPGGAPRRFAALAGVFLLLAADEAFQMHETLGRFVPASVQRLSPLTGCYTWVYIGLPLAAAAGLVFLPLVWKLDRSARRLVIVAAGLFVGGALGLEVVGGLVKAMYSDPLYHVVTHAEEWCEMAGISVLVFALLRELAVCPPVRLTVALPVRRGVTAPLFTAQ